MDSFSVTHKLTFRDYLNFQYKLLYSNIWAIVISVFSGCFIVFSIGVYFLHYDNGVFDSYLYFAGLILTMAGTSMPLTTYIMAHLGFKTNKILQEAISYKISDQGVNIVGESFESQIRWNNLYKIKLLNGWLILHQSKLVANIIKIKENDRAHIDSLKVFLEQGNYAVILKM